MATGSLPGSGAAAAHLITIQGNAVMAHVHGMKHPVDAAHPGAFVGVSKKTMLEHPARGKGKGKVVNLHRAYHTDPKSLPPALLKMLEAMIETKMHTRDLHAGMQPPKPKATAAMPPPPMPGGLPGSY